MSTARVGFDSHGTEVIGKMGMVMECDESTGQLELELDCTMTVEETYTGCAGGCVSQSG